MPQKIEEVLVKREMKKKPDHVAPTYFGHHDHRTNTKWDKDSPEARDPREGISGGHIDEEIARLTDAGNRTTGLRRLQLYGQATSLERDSVGVGRKSAKDIVLPIDKKTRK